jgi:diketogulonate reductase-like aldo/keto reductase
MVEYLTTLLERTTVVPAVNQIEVHPYFQQTDVQALDAKHGIVTQAWYPIGGITSPSTATGSTAAPLQDPVIGGIAEAHRQTPAQVMLRWHLQQGRSGAASLNGCDDRGRSVKVRHPPRRRRWML